MRLINDFKVVNPEIVGPNGQDIEELEIYCPDHPLWEPMEYRLATDRFKCTGVAGICGRIPNAEDIFHAIQSGA